MLNTDTLQPIPPARPKRENRFNKPAGEILALLATELQALKESLTEQSVALKHQADLLELTYDAILEADSDSVVSFWSRGAERMYGWPQCEALNRNVHELLRTSFPYDRARIETELSKTGRWEGELVRIRKDGSQIVVASRWALRTGEGHEHSGIIEINCDITRKKQAEKQIAAYAGMLKKQSEDLANALDEVQQASAVKSRFLASVSHELRTPLNGIIGFAELLHDGVIGPITSAQAACLSDILVCSDDLLRFVNAILAMTSLEGARPDLERDARASFLATPPNLLDRGHRPADA